jgi:hypothetical protein
VSGATTCVVQTVGEKLCNRVLDLKLKCDKAGRAPTRYELAQVRKIVPNTITEEIEQMFGRYSKGLDYE